MGINAHGGCVNDIAFYSFDKYIRKSEHRFKILATTSEGSEHYREPQLLDGTRAPGPKVNTHPWNQLLGFGRDRESGDYKLVRLLVNMGWETWTVCTQCELFSLKTREWRYVGQVPVPCFACQPSASVNGSIYWFTAYVWETEASEYSTEAKIVAFDLHTQSFRAVPHPRDFCVTKPSFRIQLMNLRDQRWIVEQSHCPRPHPRVVLDWSEIKARLFLDYDQSLDMWRMDRKGAAWDKIYSIDLNIFRVACMEIVTPVEVYSYGKVLIKGKSLGSLIKHPSDKLRLQERFLKYDALIQTLLPTAIQPFGLAPNFHSYLLATYHQSLFPLS
ncbi:unnamed protein product [Thlaspi arvense]|uniref:F-box associated beta-propeller type 1 domain-containing protein n=1 Tax=Thlaspi arvense TaxID=13288 RepID=A0AAU9T2G1_THLAR|nr:unnamed protein product [Thlaspi arvense]